MQIPMHIVATQEEGPGNAHSELMFLLKIEEDFVWKLVWKKGNPSHPIPAGLDYYGGIY